MDEKTARDMDRLLAAGQLSGPEADAVLEHVLAAVDRAERKRRPRVIRYWPVAAGAALAAAAAVLLVVYRPHDPAGRVHTIEEGDLGARPVLEVECRGGTLAACPKGSELAFTLSGKGAHGFLSAYAEPVGHDAKPVFYFSKESGTAELGPPAQATPATQRSVRLSDEHRAARYRVHAFVADRMLSREEMESGGHGARVVATLQVELVIVE